MAMKNKLKNNYFEMNEDRAKLRAAGAPDTKDPAFIAECHRQSLLAAESDKQDVELQEYMDAAFAEMCADPEWTWAD